VDHLMPKVDARDRFKKAKPEGFLEDTANPPWTKKVSDLFGKLKTRAEEMRHKLLDEKKRIIN